MGDCKLCDGTGLCLGCGQPCPGERCAAGVVMPDGHGQ